MAMLFKRHSIKETIKIIHERPVPIVADAAIATTAMGDGRLIPLVIVDTSARSDLEEFIRVHQHIGPGDVDTQWARLKDSTGRIGLLLSFKRPVEITALLAFDPGSPQGGLVDQIVHSRGLYIQAGRPGDRYIKNPDAPKIIAEIPDTGFSAVWNDIFFQATVKRLRANGLTKREARAAASSFIAGWRDFGKKVRMKRHPQS
jgi:hypothetical protein